MAEDKKSPRNTRQVETYTAEAAPIPSPQPTRFAWARYPEFWIILLVAAFLRLWYLDHAQWLADQAQLMTIARDAWLHGQLPITGIPSSLHTFNPPLSIYILMPFFLFTKNPMLALIALALWNIFGVALCYIFALRHFSRRVAFLAALVFAGCGAAITYSRFIWQQNYLPPLLLLWAFTLYAGAIRGRRAWFALHLLLLAMIICLHPTGVALIAVTAVALLIAPHWPTRRDALIGVGLVALLLLPTILWEWASNFVDVRLLLHFTGQRSAFNFDVFHAFDHLLGAPTYLNAGTNTPYPDLLDTTLYSRLGRANQILQYVVMLLYIGSYIVLTLLALTPLRRVRVSSEMSSWRRVWGWLLALRQALQADARWRSYVLLWVWITIPPLLMLRHSQPVQPHYLFILYPALFLSVGIAADTFTREAPRLLSALRIQSRRAWPLITWGALIVVLLVAVGQTTQSTLFLVALGADQVNYINYGYPLNELLAADNAIGTIQRDQHAGEVMVSMPWYYTVAAMNSTLIREYNDRTGVTGDCLVLPAPQANPSLVVSTQAISPQAQLLARLPNATHVQDYPIPGDEPLVIYRLTGQTPTLPDERALPSATWQDGHGSVLRLVAGAQTAAGVIRLRWVVSSVAATGAAETPQYEIRVQTAVADASTPAARASCKPTHLQAGDTIFTWVTTSWSAAGTDLTKVAPPLPGGPLTLTVMHGTQALWQGQIGPVHLLSAASGGKSLAPMSTSGGNYTLPISLTSPSTP